MVKNNWIRNKKVEVMDVIEKCLAAHYGDGTARVGRNYVSLRVLESDEHFPRYLEISIKEVIGL